MFNVDTRKSLEQTIAAVKAVNEPGKSKSFFFVGGNEYGRVDFAVAYNGKKPYLAFLDGRGLRTIDMTKESLRRFGRQLQNSLGSTIDLDNGTSCTSEVDGKLVVLTFTITAGSAENPYTDTFVLEIHHSDADRLARLIAQVRDKMGR